MQREDALWRLDATPCQRAQATHDPFLAANHKGFP
jgi:hypothetical protein